ncbi:hypothetical protein BU23DRAFT_335940 [Bimuria novae-zelandiae CBS 107.79]|uniref:F-box domain-containing protein n=1 Tax=Bimuria novae-zelandiae CBS 107.79 TaxID=1447943 RepID=A0A6A5UL69_9PLEO|nr:hypothetical protein BU23DRAFT_335940 [Bimuria novae-zelandiae CBS 107.79]
MDTPSTRPWCPDCQETCSPAKLAQIQASNLTEDEIAHRHCAKPASWQQLPVYIQTTLINKNGQMALATPQGRPRRERCTPAPNTVRRIANTPTYSTNDSTLSSFLRLPPELRIKVYNLLLISEKYIQHGICPSTLRFIFREFNRYHYPHNHLRPWIRHGLFPSILRCCKLIYQEGTSILYGENDFFVEDYGHFHLPVNIHGSISRSPYNNPLVGSWYLSKRNLALITKLHLTALCHDPFDRFQVNFGLGYGPRNQLNQLSLLPGLKEPTFEFLNVSTTEFCQLLEEAGRRGFGNLRRLLFALLCTNEFTAVETSQSKEWHCAYFKSIILALGGDSTWAGRKLFAGYGQSIYDGCTELAICNEDLEGVWESLEDETE